VANTALTIGIRLAAAVQNADKRAPITADNISMRDAKRHSRDGIPDGPGNQLR
jgi:hypothetical protein